MLTKKWLVTSVDGFLDLRIDGNVFPCALEIKTMPSPTTLNKAQTAAAQMMKRTYCSFGDKLFRKGVKSQYQLQCIHHSCVMKVDLVLFLVGSD
jgi:hypothetical protein